MQRPSVFSLTPEFSPFFNQFGQRFNLFDSVWAFKIFWNLKKNWMVIFIKNIMNIEMSIIILDEK